MEQSESWLSNKEAFLANEDLGVSMPVADADLFVYYFVYGRFRSPPRTLYTVYIHVNV